MTRLIEVRGAKEHNLKNIDVDIPTNELVIITGLSGSGKSSLAFDTIYAEGQRRYVESLSSYARQFLNLQNKPDVESITGLSPAIAIDQKTTTKNPRSTVGTITEIYDYLRLIFSRVGVPYSPVTNLPIKSQTSTEIIEAIRTLPAGTKVYILAPIARGEKGEYRSEFLQLRKQGFSRVFIDDIMYEIDDLPNIDKHKKHNIEIIIDRLIINNALGNRLASSVELALKVGHSIIYIDTIEEDKTKERLVFSEKYACPVSGFQLTELSPRIFSFNSPFGACPICSGLGQETFFDLNLIVPNKHLSIKNGAIHPWQHSNSKMFMQTFEGLAKHYGFDLEQPFYSLKDAVKNILFYGSGNEKIEFTYIDNIKSETVKTVFGGILPSLEEKYNKTDNQVIRDDLSKYLSERQCKACSGYRLKQESLCVKIDSYNIGQISNMTILQMQEWIQDLSTKLTNKEKYIAERIIKEIISRLSFLMNVGLEYLTLARQASTLSGGESQRIRLASQIGSGLSGVLYVLDEPSIGLHQRDNMRLIHTMKNLRDLGNTLIVVEHDEETMMHSDHIIDVGPGAGIRGGYIVAQGTIEDIKASENSITGQYLSKKKVISVPKSTRQGHENKFIELKGAKAHNLKNLSIKIKLGMFIAVTGVSGSGKSSLIIDTLYQALIKKLEPSSKAQPAEFDEISGYEHIDKIIDIDQSPIGRTPRSNPATYTGVFSLIRDWFMELPESRARGYKVGRFSFNVKGGRCEACQGDGLIKVEMHFLPDIYVKCDVCNGQRYNGETLEIKYKGKSIADVLNMNVEDAMEFFNKVPDIYEKLRTLYKVGLGYVKIGQSATTLSGGEAQRVKLAKELARKSTGKTLYIFDEPTTGLHADDVNKLLYVLHKLVDMGNTIIVIEHNMDVIKTADHIIDLGPEGGNKGGYIISEGTPMEIIKCKNSVTGEFLQKYL